MRSAYRISLFLLFCGIAVAGAQINPATQIRWPSNCVGGNLFYDIVHNTCTAGSTGGGGGTANPAPPNGSYQFNQNGSLGGNAYVLDASSFGGTTWDAKVNACLQAIYTAGGGTCDARSLSGNQTMSNSVTVGNGSAPTVLLMGVMNLNRASGAQFLVNANSQLIGMGRRSTLINGDTTIPAVQQAYGSISNTKWEHFGVQGSGAVTTGVAGVQFGGPNSGIPMPNWPGTTTQNGLIGQAGPTDLYTWPGYIAQFAIYDHALTAAQIEHHYTVGTTGSGYEAVVATDSPIAYFPLKETSGTTAVDVVGGHNGTYTGGITLAAANGIPGDTSCGGVCKMPLFGGQGSYQYIALPNLNWLSSTDWTVEGWFQPNIPEGTWKRMWEFGDAGNYVYLTQNSSNAGLQIASSYSGILSQGQVSMDAGVMHHIVIVHVSSPVPGLLFYEDGFLIRTGSDVFQSTLNDVQSSGFDIGLQMKSEGGCICYNQIIDVNLAGNTYGLDTENVSGYGFGVNSNTFVNGQYGGAIGIHTNGGTVNTFIKPDMEGNSTASYELNDQMVYMISPYEESSGPPILNGGHHYITGVAGGDYGGSCTTCTYVSPLRMPDYWAVNKGYLFGKSSTPDSGSGTSTAFTAPTGNPFDGVDLVQMGNSVNTYGKAGHAPLKVGPLFTYGGVKSSGPSTFFATGAPPPPTAAAVGGTGTTYTYFAVGYGIFGEPTLPSGPVTVSGPATLDSTHYITVTPPRGVDGIWCWDILKGDTSHVLTFDGVNHCTNLNAYLGINDTGQGTVGYTPATRDSTGDITVQGWVNGGAFGISGCAPGTYLKADFSGCANPFTGAVSNTTLTVGTTTIAAGLPCAGPFTVSMPGVTNSMTIKFTPSSDISSVTGWGPTGGGGLYFIQWPTTDTVNYKICNATTSAITPTASTTWNVSAR